MSIHTDLLSVLHAQLETLDAQRAHIARLRDIMRLFCTGTPSEVAQWLIAHRAADCQAIASELFVHTIKTTKAQPLTEWLDDEFPVDWLRDDFMVEN